MVAYGVAANLPFIAIQRYNRLRVCAGAARDGSPGRRRRRAGGVRPPGTPVRADISGSSIP